MSDPIAYLSMNVDGIIYRINNNDLTADVISYTVDISANSIIPSSVTSGSDNYSVTIIDASAFLDCSGLTSIVIPNSVTTIGSSAFANCSNLINVTIENAQNITSLSTDSFTDVSSNSNSIITFQGVTRLADLSSTWQTIATYFATQSPHILIQTILSNFSVSEKTFGDSSFALSPPSSNSSGAFSYSSSDLSVATVSGDMVTIIGAGSATITASQAETELYTAETTTASLQVNKLAPTLSNFSIAAKTFGDSPFMLSPPNSDSLGAFSYSSSDLSVATVSGDMVTIVGAGSATITASQEETSNYTAETTTASLQVNKLAPTLSNFSVAAKTFGDSPFMLSPPNSDSLGAFSYSSSDLSVATVSGDMVTIVGAGSATITASQEETSNYTAETTTASLQVNKLAPTLSNFSIAAKTFGDSPFMLSPPNSDSLGAFSYSSSDLSVATVSGDMVTIIGAGSATITASQDETSNYTAETTTASLQVNKLAPTLSNFSIAAKTFGDSPFMLSPPNSDSLGAFSYSSSDLSVATVSGDMVTIIGAGSATITASQEETSNYTAETTTASLQVNKLAPTLSNFSVAEKTFGDSSFMLSPPNSDSLGAFSYSSSDLSVATVSGDMVTIIGAGSATITASQEETANYTAETTTASLQVNKLAPTLTNFSVAAKTFGDSSFALSPPSSNSPGAFSYSSSDLSVATISGDMVTIVGAGSATITASQEETSNYTAETTTASLQVNKLAPTLTNFSVAAKTFGDSSFALSPPSSNSPGAFSYSSSDLSVATVSGDMITIVGAGSATITASQEETANYTAETTTASLQVNKLVPTLTNFSVAEKTFGDSSFALSPPSSNSPGAFSYSSSDLSVATISGDMVTIVGAGSATITASQEETANYTAETTTASLQVNKLVPTLTNFSVAEKTFGDSSFALSPPSSNSPGAFSYSSSDLSVATIPGDMVTIVGAGSATITASQEETANYTAETTTASLQVNKLVPTLTNFSVAEKTFGDSSFALSPPSSNSPGAFSYSSSDLSVATISGDMVTIVGAGSATITASQEETANYTAETTTASLQVNKLVPTLTNFSVAEKTFGDSSFALSPPSSNSPGAFSYSSSNLSVATISGDMVTIVGAGSATITASQEETSNYTAETTTAVFQVNKLAPTLTNFSVAAKTFGDIPFMLSPPSSNSPGAFSYSSSNLSVATVSGDMITIISDGSATITASQAETANYTSRTTTSVLQVSKSTPTNPVIITNSNDFEYFMQTTSMFVNIINSVEIDNLISSTNKKLTTTSNSVKISRPAMIM